MVTTVYIDVLFFENFILDFFILYITAFIMGYRMKILRAAAASFIGAFYMCSIYLSEFIFIENVMLKAIVMTAMIFITFKVRSFVALIKYIMTFLFVNICLGGCIYFFASAFSGFSIKNGVYYVETPLFAILCGIMMLFISGRFFIVLFKKNISDKKMKKELILIYKNKKMKLNTLLDTGNSLIDPISHNSVLVVSKIKLKELVDENNISSIKNFRLIPCRTVTDRYELLYGFKPDKFFYKDKEINAIVAISKSEFEGDYDAVINPLTLV